VPELGQPRFTVRRLDATETLFPQPGSLCQPTAHELPPRLSGQLVESRPCEGAPDRLQPLVKVLHEDGHGIGDVVRLGAGGGKRVTSKPGCQCPLCVLRQNRSDVMLIEAERPI
jgi:hypothetical protein